MPVVAAAGKRRPDTGSLLAMTDHPDLSRLMSPDRRNPLVAVPVLVGAILVVALALTWPVGEREIDLTQLGISSEAYRARVTTVTDGPCSFATHVPCTTALFTLLEGPTPGTVSLQEFEDLPSTPRFAEGEVVIMSYIPDAPPSFQYQFADRDRRGLLLAVTALFSLTVVAFGRMRGFAALAGLAASVVVMLVYVVPAIIQGSSPVLIATIGASTIGFLALYLSHGFRSLTHVALVGTLGALAITVALSGLVLAAARFSGFAGEESIYLSLVGDIDVRGLLLAGIVLGALGALDDVTVTQASAVWEVSRANRSLTAGELYRAGVRVGRDHIASTVNTLLLAYAGAAMPLLLLLTISQQGLGIIANSEIVAVEIVRTLVGSIGLVSAVPITTLMAARVVSRLTDQELIDGH
jgi:uncharacterized membrane protein